MNALHDWVLAYPAPARLLWVLALVLATLLVWSLFFCCWENRSSVSPLERYLSAMKKNSKTKHQSQRKKKQKERSVTSALVNDGIVGMITLATPPTQEKQIALKGEKKEKKPKTLKDLKEENKEEKQKVEKEEKQKPVKEEKQKAVKEEKQKVVKEEKQKAVKEEKQKVVKEEKQKAVKEEKQKAVKEEKQKVVKEEKQKAVKEEKQKAVKEEKQKEVKEEKQKVINEEKAEKQDELENSTTVRKRNKRRLKVTIAPEAITFESAENAMSVTARPRLRERSASEESRSELCSSAFPGDTLPWNLAKHQRVKRSKSASGDVLDPAERAVIRIAAITAQKVGDGCLVRRPDAKLVFQFIPKVFSGVEVRALCRPLKFFHNNLGEPCLHGPRFVHRGIVMLEQVCLL
ncbi:hypothetical protein PGIGA_G00140000 [Pangasianodon gigas]|uniref:Uncharacterized protein n=1 Tax=Pangasianodon gigas TaxID=30993 RepID=A0ACC5XL36_PANGG|nr:hypothetical protein [Pangasianodon gigas]